MAIHEKIRLKGWTPGVKDVAGIVDSWLSLSEDDRDAISKKIERLEPKALQKLIGLTASATLVGDLTMQTAILRNLFSDPTDERFQLASEILNRSPNRTSAFVRALKVLTLNSNTSESLQSSVVAIIKTWDHTNDLTEPDRRYLFQALAQSPHKLFHGLASSLLETKPFIGLGGVWKQKLMIKNRETERQSSTPSNFDAQSEMQRFLGRYSSDVEIVLEFSHGLSDLFYSVAEYRGWFETITLISPTLCKGRIKAESIQSILQHDLPLRIGIAFSNANSLDLKDLADHCVDMLLRINAIHKELPFQKVRLGRDSDLTKNQIWMFAQAISARKTSIICEGISAHWDVKLFSDVAALFPKSKMQDDPVDIAHAVAGRSQTSIATALATLALINCEAKSAKLSVWDPFCGSGSELKAVRELSSIFRKHATIELLGTDINPDVIAIARRTMREASDEAMTFENRDANSVTKSFDIILSNPPFGMRTQRGAASSIMETFFARLPQTLKEHGILAIVAPAPKRYRELGEAAGLTLLKTFPIKLGGMGLDLQVWTINSKGQRPRSSRIL